MTQRESFPKLLHETRCVCVWCHKQIIIMFYITKPPTNFVSITKFIIAPFILDILFQRMHSISHSFSNATALKLWKNLTSFELWEFDILRD